MEEDKPGKSQGILTGTAQSGGASLGGEKQLVESIADLAKVVETLRLKLVDKPKKFIFYNFISGIASGLGTAIGASIIFAAIIWLLSKMQIVPVLGNWAVTILDYIQKARGH